MDFKPGTCVPHGCCSDVSTIHVHFSDIAHLPDEHCGSSYDLVLDGIVICIRRDVCRAPAVCAVECHANINLAGDFGLQIDISDTGII